MEWYQNLTGISETERAIRLNELESVGFIQIHAPEVLNLNWFQPDGVPNMKLVRTIQKAANVMLGQDLLAITVPEENSRRFQDIFIVGSVGNGKQKSESDLDILLQLVPSVGAETSLWPNSVVTIALKAIVTRVLNNVPEYIDIDTYARGNKASFVDVFITYEPPLYKNGTYYSFKADSWILKI